MHVLKIFLWIRCKYKGLSSWESYCSPLVCVSAACVWVHSLSDSLYSSHCFIGYWLLYCLWCTGYIFTFTFEITLLGAFPSAGHFRQQALLSLTDRQISPSWCVQFCISICLIIVKIDRAVSSLWLLQRSIKRFLIIFSVVKEVVHF